MDLLSKKYKQTEEISNLKAEIKRLKECNEELTSDNLNTIQEMDNERRRVEQFREENEKLQETLQEIKAIAKEYLTDCQGFKCEAMEEIMQKITKAEEE